MRALQRSTMVDPSLAENQLCKAITFSRFVNKMDLAPTLTSTRSVSRMLRWRNGAGVDEEGGFASWEAGVRRRGGDGGAGDAWDDGDDGDSRGGM